MYLYFTDPGHGWLRVKKTELAELGIAHKITNYSYERGNFAYLEEDCDLTTFAEAKFENAQKSLKFFKNDVNYRHTDRQSKIRNYSRYQNPCKYIAGMPII